jgi:hypothetical protein
VPIYELDVGAASNFDSQCMHIDIFISPIKSQVAAIHYICGIVVVSVAHSFSALIVGRVFVGLGVGFGLAVRCSK